MSLQAFVEGSPPMHFCGGTLFNGRTVITAAHCCKVFDEVAGRADLEVVAGELLLDSSSGNEQRRKSISYKIHECKLSFILNTQTVSLSLKFSFFCKITFQSELNLVGSVAIIFLGFFSFSFSRTFLMCSDLMALKIIF